MNIFEAVVQGTIQGLTEFLPISSSGHLAIFQYFLNIQENNLIFNVALHIGTLISVVLVYRGIIFEFIYSFFVFIVNFFKFKKDTKEHNSFVTLFISCLPLFLLFFKIPYFDITLKDIAKNNTQPENLFNVGLSLIITSVFLITGAVVFRFKKVFLKDGIKKITYKDSIIIGLVQLFAAIFPGLSRSGSTFSTGIILGIERTTAVDFSFLMSIPTIIAAALLELLEIKSNKISLDSGIFLTGITVSAITGIVSIVFLKWLLKNNKTWIFALYTLLLGIILTIV
ncbi:MAG: undecaprenyl-diphosphate phosphatase [Candidatus Improbicoccus pseudotrichonymphae]|uniref:Undecaprenyl-diphosphatase n=1 Tax=Candidatus Improbicoccus pseudotrichonymphae TaxID=3033792 RepID=A0AA48KYL9_9FIRM|nr:MAG: undecaprenyl-diphosphate phosphatase [Candidatus Improbicoccus pseudotrichonymphae]